MKSIMLAEPITIRLPGYRCQLRVPGFERRRNAGPVLTMAIADSLRDGCEEWKPFSDIVSLMKLADMLSNNHELPINADRLYGPTGRGVTIGRNDLNAPGEYQPTADDRGFGWM